MKSFLLKNNIPIVKWGLIPDNTFFQGTVPDGYDLAVCPSGSYVVLDVDNKNGKCGFDHIPFDIGVELGRSFNYFTKSGGAHCWLDYTGDKVLLNKSTPLGLDLRIGKNEKTGNNGGYVKYRYNKDIRECTHLIKKTGKELNEFLEKLFM